MAVTLVSPPIVTTQVPTPLHPPPLQPAKVAPLAAVGVSVTLWPNWKPALQVEPQEIPAGLEVTVPRLAPLPALLTDSVYWPSAKVAVTLCAPVMVTTHGPAPVQAPDQPVKVAPGMAEADSVTIVPAA